MAVCESGIGLETTLGIFGSLSVEVFSFSIVVVDFLGQALCHLQIVGQTEEQYMAQLKERAKEELTNYLILDNVAKKEGLSEVTPEELEFEYAKLAEQYSRTVEEIKNIIEPQLNSFKNDLVMNRADKFLYENND